MRELDETDRAILQVLRKNARETIKGISAQTNLARSTVRHRLQKLESDSVITGYRVELKSAATSGFGAFLFVRLKRTPAIALIEEIASFPEVLRCYSLAGDPDLLIEVRAGSPEALNEVRNRISNNPVVEELRTSLILNRELEG
ncbi:Lrp/AsnC family transcriptional regulator [Kiloniella laminariae]|uniref:Lrp/AsnC family transcriptional regulator n=1 Tax=Kiloniella laminariae TaxID=454162 RepID=UPI00035F7B06|nr:Lrp/AsnC family transcriptional regulator [Kiloniella laminariae]